MNSYNGWAQVAYREKYTTSLWEARKSYTETPFSLAHGIPGAFTIYVIISCNKDSFIHEHTYTHEYYNKQKFARLQTTARVIINFCTLQVTSFPGNEHRYTTLPSLY